VGEFEVRGRKATIKLWSLAEPEESSTHADKAARTLQ
jgi:hypothetical protein